MTALVPVDRNDREFLTELERRRMPNPWLTPVATGVAGAITSALLLWLVAQVAENETSLALILERQQANAEKELVRATYVDQTMRDIRERLNKLWPRTRTHGENIQILENEFEQLCRELTESRDCQIELNIPEEF